MISIPALTMIIATLHMTKLSSGLIFEPPLLYPVLQTLFVLPTSLAVAYLSARGYLASGSVTLLPVGSGVLVIGCGTVVGSLIIVLPGGTNVGVMLANVGFLVGAALNTVGAALTAAGVSSTGLVPGRARFNVMLAYLGVLLYTGWLTIAGLQEATPLFFVQGVGPTPLRQAVLGGALALFVVSSLTFMRLYFKSKADILFWYSLALASLAVTVVAFFTLRVVGGPISWTGRIAQWLGSIYFLLAVLSTVRGKS